jgi:hypothetical protein
LFFGQTERCRTDLERRNGGSRADVAPGKVALRELVPVARVLAQRDHDWVERDLGDQALVEVLEHRLLDRERWVRHALERPVGMGCVLRRWDDVHEGLVDVEPAAEERVDLAAVRMRGDVLHVPEHLAGDGVRVGLLVHVLRRRVDPRQREERQRHVLAPPDAGERNRLAVGIVRRAPVRRAWRVVVSAACRLRLEEPEEDANLGRPDQADVPHAREREVEDRRVAVVLRVDIERGSLLVRRQHARVVERLPGRGAVSARQVLRDVLDEVGRVRRGRPHRVAELRLARPHHEHAQVDAQPGWVAVQHERIGLLDQLDLAGAGDVGDRGVQRDELRRAAERERGIVRVGAEVEIVLEGEPLHLRPVVPVRGPVAGAVDVHAGDRRGDRQRRRGPSHADRGGGVAVDDDAERVGDDGAWPGELPARIDLVLADRASVDDELEVLLRHDRGEELLDPRARVGPKREEAVRSGVEAEVVPDEGDTGIAVRPRRVDCRVPRLVRNRKVDERRAAVERLRHQHVDLVR